MRKRVLIGLIAGGATAVAASSILLRQRLKQKTPTDPSERKDEKNEFDLFSLDDDPDDCPCDRPGKTFTKEYTKEGLLLELNICNERLGDAEKMFYETEDRQRRLLTCREQLQERRKTLTSALELLDNAVADADRKGLKDSPRVRVRMDHIDMTPIGEDLFEEGDDVK